MASFKERTAVFGDQTLNLKAGQLVISQLHLALSWHWNRETVNKYLKRLKLDGQITYRTSNRFTLITISKWDIYQNTDRQIPATKPTAKPTTAQQQGNIRTSTYNNVYNNDNNEKKENLNHILILKTQFQDLSQRYNSDKLLIKNHFLKEGYTEFQIEEAFHKYGEHPCP